MAKVIAENDIAIFSFPVVIIRWLSAPEAPDHRVTLSLDSPLRGFALRTQSGGMLPPTPPAPLNIFQHHHFVVPKDTIGKFARLVFVCLREAEEQRKNAHEHLS